MRKLNLLILFILLCLISACTPSTTDKPLVVATIFPQYDIARSIGGDKIELHMAVSPGVDAHHFDPSVSDIIMIKKADLFIYTFDEMEPWAEGLKSEEAGKITLNLSTLEGIVLEEAHEEHEEGHVHTHHHDFDPHLWTSIKHLQIIARGICDNLCLIDEANKDYYQNNCNTYISKLLELETKYQELSILATEATFYFATPFAMFYLFDEFNLKYESLYDTCSMEVEPSLNDIIAMNEELKIHNVKYIYVKELTSTAMATRVIQGTDCQIQILHSGHNLASTDFSSGLTLLEILENNLEALKKGVA